MPHKFTLVKVVDTGANFQVVLAPDSGSVLSCQDNGELHTAPIGSEGPREVCCINGNIAVFSPSDGNTYTFEFIQDVPNHDGWSGIYLIAL